MADLELDLTRRKATRQGDTILLTAKEFALWLLMRREGEILPRATIASQVWDMNFNSDTNVVDSAIRRLRSKIDDAYDPKLIHTVRGMGYVLEARRQRGMIARLLPRTLRGRLTALIILSTSVILASSGVALYEALSNRVDTTAAEQMAGISAALARIWPKHARPPTSRATPTSGSTSCMVIRTWISRSSMPRARAGTPGFRLVAPLMSLNAGRVPVGVAPPGARQQYLVTNVPLAGAGASAPVVRVVVQYDRSADVLLLRTHAYTIVVIEVFGVVLAAAIAYGIAALGLALRRFAARAEQMSTSRLAHPLPALDTAGELKELEHALNGMLERLNESFMRLSQFSSNLAHDMRTPLTNLQAAAQVVLSPRSADEYRNVIESSIDEYQRLSRMIEDMLFLARSEQAGTSISVRRLDASEEAGASPATTSRWRRMPA